MKTSLIYNLSWDTERNRYYFEQLEKTFFSRAVCFSDCPLSWAPEVHKTLCRIDAIYGFKYPEGLFDNPVESIVLIRNGRAFQYQGFIEFLKNVFLVHCLNPIRNARMNKRLVLAQVKEKFGTLRIYLEGDYNLICEAEKEIRKCEERLRENGAY